MGNGNFVTLGMGGTQTDTSTISADPDIAVPAGEDFTVKLGDAAGANKFIVKNSSSTTVMDWSSLGAFTLYD